MTDEQKQRAKDLIVAWKSTAYALHADAMAALLQELANAPEPEPFGYFKSEPFGWTDCAETDDGAIALYTAPPAPSVPDWMNYKQGYTDGIIEVRNELKQLCKDFSCRQDRPYMGDVHAQIDALCDRAIAECSTKSDAPTPAESPADVALDAARWRMLPAFLEEFEISYLRLEDAIDAAIAAEKGGKA